LSVRAALSNGSVWGPSDIMTSTAALWTSASGSSKAARISGKASLGFTFWFLIETR
jgi:hypothetical protein